MKVLVLAPFMYDTAPGQRFRIEQWAKHLEKKEFEFKYVPFVDEQLQRILYKPGQFGRKVILIMKALARRVRLVLEVKKYDVVFLFREAALIGPAVIESRIARQGVPLVFDFDDAIWVPYISPANRYLSYLKFFNKTADICRLSTHITVGNRHLATYARQYNSNVTVIPTTIDTEIYMIREFRRAENGTVVKVGWTGSYSTVQHLDTLRMALRELRRQQDYRLMVIGTPNYRLESVETASYQWQAESEVRDLQQFDIGIMPLPDDEWSRGKCGLKLLQCMGVGVPTVGSPVGVNTEIIRDGVNGFIAATDQEWIEKLSLLIQRPDLRQEIGIAGRQTVEQYYSARNWAPRVGQVFKSIISA